MNGWRLSEGSRYEAIFVAWFEIDLYMKPIKNIENFLVRMDGHPKREYFWSLWMKGATLEAINWYMYFQAGENLSDLQMFRQYPSDAEEAFSATGHRVFSSLVLEKAKVNCYPPLYKGQLFAKGQKEKDAFIDLRFENTTHGAFWVWDPPDTSIRVSNRYVIIADIGGKSDDADFSTIRVIDRYFLTQAGIPEAVATWKAHLDQDLFAWVCAQVAFWYNKGLLIIESNSMDTEEIEGSEGDQFLTVLNEIANYYGNLYTRTDPSKIREGVPVQWGFHTNRHTKPLVINAFNAAMRDDDYIERDQRVIDECHQFEIKPSGKMGAVEGCHDDLVIPTAIGVWASAFYMDSPKIIEEQKKKPIKHRRTEASL
jgi:hypothetical protein